MYKSFSQFFVPNGSGVLAADDVSAAAVHGEYVCVRSLQLRRILAAVSTAIVSGGTDAVIAFKRRSAPGITAGEVTLGSLTILDGLAVGEVMYKDLAPSLSEFEPGQVLAIEVTTAAGTSGGALYGFETFDMAEEAVEEANMNLSS